MSICIYDFMMLGWVDTRRLIDSSDVCIAAKDLISCLCFNGLEL